MTPKPPLSHQPDPSPHPDPRALQCFENSDKFSVKASSYFPVYDKIFEGYVGKKITFVEVGVAYGGSLQMWREYFGPDARIIGIDLYDGTPEVREALLKAKEELERDGFEIHVGNQGDPGFWRAFFDKVGKVDIILDDGSHCYTEQIVTAECTVDHIRDGGLLVVEDVWSSFKREYGGPSRRSFFSYASNCAKGVQYRFEDFAKPNYREGMIPYRRVHFESAVRAITFYQSIVVFQIDRRLCGVGKHHTNMPYPFPAPGRLRNKLRYLANTIREILRNQFLGKYFKY